MEIRAVSLPKLRLRQCDSQLSKKPQQSIENGERVRRTSCDPQVYRDGRWHTATRLLAPTERPATQRTGANGNHEARIGERVVRSLERVAHVHVHASRDDDPIRVTRGSHELYAEARHVEDDVARCIQLLLA